VRRNNSQVIATPPLAEAEEFVDGGYVEGEPEDGSEWG
jgi:hypothetical protein